VRVRAFQATHRLTLTRLSFAMTEQPRTITRARICGHVGTVGSNAMAEIDQWLRDVTAL
jgi:mRNA interferase MazF